MGELEGSVAERLRSRVAQGRLKGFVTAVAVIAFVDLCVGFTWGVIEAAGRDPAAVIVSTLNRDGGTAPPGPVVQPPQPPRHDAPNTANLSANTTPKPPRPLDVPKPPTTTNGPPVVPPPVVIDDPAPVPAVVDDPEVPHRPGQGLFEFPPDDTQPVPPVAPPPDTALGRLMREGDDLFQKGEDAMRTWQTSGSKADIKSAVQLLEQSCSKYREAKEKFGPSQELDDRLTRANRLRWVAMKHSPI